ncbi:MAG: LacI family DNA-binding transcriptional regulator [Lapillicoccus sp.]
MGTTMRDVAKLADVSQRTVSNVVNGYPHVKPGTRQRVLDAIAALRYRPNISAQKLRQGRTGMVALALPDLSTPYFAELANHLQRRAAERGITLLIEQTGGVHQRELLVLDGYRSNIIDGLILSPESVTVADLTNRDLDFPTVLLGESIDNGGVIHISIDNVAAARQATEHLLKLGRRRIAAVGSMKRLDGPAVRRLHGYADALSAADLPVAADLTFPADTWTRATGYATAAEILERPAPPDAVFCFNDTLALGLMKGLQRHGVRIPDDIAVLGWDDIEECAYSTPTLTSISPDKASIARHAVDHLLDHIHGTPPESREISTQFHLEVRESTHGQPATSERG